MVGRQRCNNTTETLESHDHFGRVPRIPTQEVDACRAGLGFFDAPLGSSFRQVRGHVWSLESEIAWADVGIHAGSGWRAGSRRGGEEDQDRILGQGASGASREPRQCEGPWAMMQRRTVLGR